ncbi:MAG: lipopolysaccharide biosynthesis protein [Bacteroidales bacterium]|nr:lipopolysaccharide biosynthesis protein [Bacteroidales bacterium]
MASSQTLKNKTIKGVFWQTVQKASSQLASFVVSVVLARMLSPDDFGVIAMTYIFMNIANVLVDCGLGSSLVQKKETDDLDINSVFYFSMGVSVFLYLLLFICAPMIARLYHNVLLVEIIRVLGLGLLFSSAISVQSAIILKQMDFKKLFYNSLISTILSGIIGLTMAFLGFGIWSLVAQTISNSAISVVTLFYLTRWRPRLTFSFTRLKGLYKFGLNYMGANLFGTFFNELKGFLIGIRYQPADLAFFNRGDTIPKLINGNITGTVSSVLFPAISKLQDDKAAVKSAMQKSMMTTTFIIAPLLTILIASADSVIPALYSYKWAEAIPFLQILGFGYLFSVLGSVNLLAMNAIGRSDVTLILEFVKKPVFLFILLYTIKISPMALAIGTSAYALYATSVNALPNKKLIGYSYREQLHDILPQLFLAFGVGCIAFLIGRMNWNCWLSLFVQWGVGISLYIGFAILVKMESYQYVKETALDFLKCYK